MSESVPRYRVQRVVFPIASWKLEADDEAGHILLRFGYLAAPDDDPKAPRPSRLHVMTRQQAVELATELLILARTVNKEGAGSPIAPVCIDAGPETAMQDWLETLPKGSKITQVNLPPKDPD